MADSGKSEGKRSFKYYKTEDLEQEQEDEEGEDDDEELEFEDEEGKKKIRATDTSSTESSNKGSCGGGEWSTSSVLCCQADNCSADLSNAKRYHRRHKVCEFHFKSPVVSVAGLHQRFCQQCSRFHEVSEFDEAKKSCRKRLAGHNERRRKISSFIHNIRPD